MPNSIPTLQNNPDHLKLLRAQRRLYARARALLGIQVFLSVLVPVVSSLLVVWFPDLKAVTAAVALVIVLLDITVLDRAQKALRRSAALVQEEFDCAVLDLPWDRFTVGARPDPETVAEAATDYVHDQTQPLENWYPVVVGRAPLHLGRLISQRTNLWYDAKLRSHYGAWALTLSVILGTCLLMYGVISGMPLNDLLLSVATPILPIMIWGIRENFRQREAADASTRLREQAQGLWDRALRGECSQADCTEEARLFQNAIFDRRSRAPVIFNWVYSLMRSRLEGHMNEGAEAMVARALVAENKAG